MEEEKILRTLVRLEGKVDALVKRVQSHETKLRWVTSVALVVIGVVGGPNAAQLVAGGGVAG